MIIKRIANSLRIRMRRILNNSHYAHCGKQSRIIRPMRIIGKNRIHMGDHVTILNNARIEVLEEWKGKPLNAKLVIGDGTSIEQNCHIISASAMSIGKDCVFSAFVYVSDCSHGYNPDERIMDTELSIHPVHIGDHCFVGIGSCIMPGSTLGNNVVIGANSVVNGYIPDNCMAVGSPARIIKKWNGETWKKS